MRGRGETIGAGGAEATDDRVYERFVRVAHVADGPAETDVAGNSAGPDPVTGLDGVVRGVGADRGPHALAAFDPGRRGVRALAAVAILAILIAGFVAWRSRPRSQQVGALTEAAVSLSGPDNPTPGTVVVAVTGRVQRPGLVRLPAGARVADAIEAAGGVLPATDLSLLNLARKLVDGELVLVGVTPSGSAGVVPGAPAGGSPAKVNLNTAGVTELQTLPGVGPVLAQRIIDYRTKHGTFRSTTDLHRVSGFGNARFEQLKDLVTV